MQKGSKQSEEARIKMSHAKSGENHPMYGVKGEEHPLWGRELSEETKKKISQTNSKAVRGIKLINLTTKEVRKTPYDEILTKLDEGWQFKSQKVMINNGVDYQRIIPTYRLNEFFPNKGWNFGSLEKK